MSDLSQADTWKKILDETYVGLKGALTGLAKKKVKISHLKLWVHPDEMPLFLYDDEDNELGEFEVATLAKEFKRSKRTLDHALLELAFRGYLPLALKRASNDKLFDAVMADSLTVAFATADSDDQELFTLEQGEKPERYDVDAEFKKVGVFAKSEAGNFVDKRDGKKYVTLKVGNQEWLAENLAFDLPGDEGCCYYEDDKRGALKKGFGALYRVEAAKAACPPGWRLPTKSDWKALLDHVGRTKCDLEPSDDEDQDMWEDVGGVLRGKAFGFNWKGSGYRVGSRHYQNGVGAKGNGVYWVYDADDKMGSMTISYGSNDVDYFEDETEDAFSIRCVRDA